MFLSLSSPISRFYDENAKRSNCLTSAAETILFPAIKTAKHARVSYLEFKIYNRNHSSFRARNAPIRRLLSQQAILRMSTVNAKRILCRKDSTTSCYLHENATDDSYCRNSFQRDPRPCINSRRLTISNYYANGFACHDSRLEGLSKMELSKRILTCFWK